MKLIKISLLTSVLLLSLSSFSGTKDFADPLNATYRGSSGQFLSSSSILRGPSSDSSQVATHVVYAKKGQSPCMVRLANNSHLAPRMIKISNSRRRTNQGNLPFSKCNRQQLSEIAQMSSKAIPMQVPEVAAVGLVARIIGFLGWTTTPMGRNVIGSAVGCVSSFIFGQGIGGEQVHPGSQITAPLGMLFSAYFGSSKIITGGTTAVCGSAGTGLLFVNEENGEFKWDWEYGKQKLAPIFRADFQKFYEEAKPLVQKGIDKGIEVGTPLAREAGEVIIREGTEMLNEAMKDDKGDNQSGE